MHSNQNTLVLHTSTGLHALLYGIGATANQGYPLQAKRFVAKQVVQAYVKEYLQTAAQ